VAYDGVLGNPAIGTDIVFTTITGLGTPANPGVTLTCTGCFLNFTTGGSVSEGPALWDFGPGGTITVSTDATGSVTGPGFPGLGANTNLLTGSFAGTPNEIIGPGEALGLFAAGGLDVKNETLAGFFGLGPNFIHATTSIQSDVTVGADGSFSGSVVNADLNNIQPVPEPATILLLGVGLVGAAVARRRLSS
jgi:hypothetical protein